jgi:hypothetical protein
VPYIDGLSCSLPHRPFPHTSFPPPRPARKSDPNRNDQVLLPVRYSPLYVPRIELVLVLGRVNRRKYIKQWRKWWRILVVVCSGLCISFVRLYDDFIIPSCPKFSRNCLIYGPGRPFNASKQRAVSSVTHAVPRASAAARHFAIATSCVVPWTSGTEC